MTIAMREIKIIEIEIIKIGGKGEVDQPKE